MDEQFQQFLMSASKEQVTWGRFYSLLIDSYEESKVALFPCTQVDPEKPYYLCQSGLPKRIYTHRLGIPGQDYAKLFEFQLYPTIVPMLEMFGYSGSVHMVIDDEKEACILIQPTEKSSLPVIEFAEQIDLKIQEVYCSYLPHGTGRYRNTTVLSSPVTGIAALRDAYLQTEALKSTAFFRMAPGVLTAGRVRALENHAAYRQVIDMARSLCQACAQGEEARMNSICERLFLDLLKHSFSMDLVRDALSWIKQFLSVRLSVHMPQVHYNLSELCDPSSYIVIEECCESILLVLSQLCRSVQNGGKWSDAVAYAAYYLRSNPGEDISLQDIAAFSDTSAAYLSNLFHRETGMTIKQYQQGIRLEYAFRLLSSTSEKIADIAAKAGFIDRRYFTRVFKDAYGMTPQEYRHSVNKNQSESNVNSTI